MKKCIKVFVILLFTMLVMNVKVYAQSFNFKVEPEEKIVTPGESVEIELSVTDIADIQEGINTIVGYLEYEEELFDSIEFIGDDNWEVTYNNIESNSLYGKFAIVSIQNGIEEDSKVATLKVKLKGSLPNGETEILFNNLVSSDGYTSIKTEDKKVKLIIKNATKEDKNISNTINESGGKVSFTENTKVAIATIVQNIKTGDNIFAYVIILVVAVILVIAIIIIRKKSKNKKEDKK